MNAVEMYAHCSFHQSPRPLQLCGECGKPVALWIAGRLYCDSCGMAPEHLIEPERCVICAGTWMSKP